MKKMMAQNGAPGSRKTTSGQVIKTRPGPDETTDSIDESVAEAMLPNIENCFIIHKIKLANTSFFTKLKFAILP